MENEISLNDVIKSISILEHVVNHSELLTELTHDQRVALFKATGTISRPDKKEIQKRQKDVKIFKQKQLIEQNRLKRAMTGIRSARENAIFMAPEKLQIESDRMETATKDAIDTIQGYIYWNRIKVEILNG